MRRYHLLAIFAIISLAAAAEFLQEKRSDSIPEADVDGKSPDFAQEIKRNTQQDAGCFYMAPCNIVGANCGNGDVNCLYKCYVDLPGLTKGFCRAEGQFILNS
jgi:hypothetical protein